MRQFSFKSKAQDYHKQRAREQRQVTFCNKRKLLERQSKEFPLTSKVMSKFCEISSRELYLYYNEIFQVLDDLVIEQLTEEDHEELCSDLIYLLLKDQNFVIPYNFQFRKDGSPFTATTAFYAMDFISKDQFNYWLSYMNDDAKECLYIKIQCEDYDLIQFAENEKLLSQIIQDWGYIREADSALAFVLQQVIEESNSELADQVFERLLQVIKNKQIDQMATASFFLIVGQLSRFYIGRNKKKYAFCRLTFNQSLIKTWNNNNTFYLGHFFVPMMDYQMELCREYVCPFLTQECFDCMMKLLLYIFQHANPNTSDLPIKQNSNKFKNAFISSVINICTNYLRINCLLKNNVHINEVFLKIIQSNNQSEHFNAYRKLCKLNNSKHSIEGCQKKDMKILEQRHLDEFQI